MSAAHDLAAALPAATAGSQVAFAFESDHAAFVVALWATWAGRHAVALPFDARRTAVASTLQLPDVMAFLHDTGAGRGIDVAVRAWPATAVAATGELPIGALTSCVPNAAGAIDRWSIAAATLQQQVAAFVGISSLRASDRLAVTYAPGHLPALVPGVLGPLQLGATVVGAASLPVADLAAHLRQHAVTALLSSPDRLRELARQPDGTWAALRWVGTLGEIDDRTAARWHRRHGVLVQELLPRNRPSAERSLEQALLAVATVDDAAVCQGSDGRWLAWVAADAPAPDLSAALASAAAVALPGVPPPLLSVHDRLPRDVNGNLPAGAIAGAVGRRRDGRPVDRQLIHGAAERTPDGWSLPVTMPVDYPGFDGHFDGYPVLSGVVQVHDVVLPALRRVAAGQGAAVEFADLKFLARIAPGDQVAVQVQLLPDGTGASFALFRGATKCSTGRVRWERR